MPQLAPLIAAIPGLFATASTFLASIGPVAKLIIGLGLQLASSWLKKQAEKKNAGVQFEREYGETQPRRVACGLVAVAGHDVYVNTHGASNGWLQQVFAVSDYPVDGLSRVAINGKWVEFDPVEHAERGFTPAAPHDLNNRVWVKLIDGRQTDADAALVANSSPTGRWTAAHVGLGMAYVIVTAQYHKEKNSSFPDFLFELRGARLYDWRKDSTAGGLGAHRWADPATHEFTENPRVIEYNYRRGLAVNGDMFCGMGQAATDLPLGPWTTAANICDEDVSGSARYRVSMFLDCLASHRDNIESLHMASAGLTVDGVDGVWPITGAAQPIVATFTDGDLVADAPVKVRLRESMAKRVNSVSGSHPDPDNLWSPTSYGTQTDSVALALDRRTRDVNMNFDTVRSRLQAESLAAIYLAENQFQASATLTLPPRFRAVRSGDWVRWNSARHGDRTWLVQASQMARLGHGQPRVKTLTLMERSASIYAGPVATIAPAVTLAAVPDYLAELADFAVIGVTASAPNGIVYPAIRVSWSPIDDVTVAEIELEYRAQGAAETFTRRVADDVSVVVLAEGVVSGTVFEVRSRLITSPARTVAWSAWQNVTTLDTPSNDVTVALSNLAADAYEAIADIRVTLDAALADMERIAHGAAVGTGRNIAEQGVAQTFRSATAVAMTTLAAEVTDIDGQLTAQAASISAVQAQTDAGTASGLIGWTATSAPGGVTARFAIEGRATSGDGWTIGGAYFDILSGGGSRWSFLSDQFVILNGASAIAPFAVEGGVVTMQNVRLGTLTFDQLASANGKLIMKGSGANASIEVLA